MWGALASAGSQGGQVIVTLAYNAVLARLITPHDFGLVTMALVVAGFLHVFKDAGLSTATIQREDITHAQVSNLFWINVAMGGVAMLGMASAAPAVAWFFGHPELLRISLLLSVAFLLEALPVQHLAILNRQMRFTLLAGVEFACVTGGLVVGVVMALGGWGYWSLVGATLSASTFRVTIVWTLSGWRPQRPMRQTGTRPLVRFGADLTLVGIVYALARGLDGVLIGRYLGSEALGLYSRATALLTRPLERLMAPIYSVIIPALSRLQTEPARYRSAFLQVFEGLAIGAFLLAGLLLPLSEAIVRVILGGQWAGAAPIFAALTLAFVYLPLATATGWLYTSQGRGRDLLATAIIAAVVTVAAFLAGLPFGPTGVAVAYSAASLLVILPVTFHIGGRTGPVTAPDLWGAAASHVPVFAAVLAATWIAREWIGQPLPALQQLLVCSGIGALAGLAAVFAFARSRRAAMTLITRTRELMDHHVEIPQPEVAK